MVWNHISVTPPDRLLQVMDWNGNVAIAQPTYYPFIFSNGEVIQCESHWDGGWMVQRKGMDEFELGKFLAWRDL